MEHVLLVVQVLIALAMIVMILIQRSDSDGFGLGGGGGSGLISGRSKANLMTRTTAILAAAFIINSLALSILAAHGRTPSIVDTIEEQQSVDGKPSVPPAGVDKKDAKPLSADEKKKEKDLAKDAKAAFDGKDKPVADEKPAAEKKPAKKPVVKPADATPSDEAADESNEE